MFKLTEAQKRFLRMLHDEGRAVMIGVGWHYHGSERQGDLHCHMAPANTAYALKAMGLVEFSYGGDSNTFARLTDKVTFDPLCCDSSKCYVHLANTKSD